jgi:ribosomal protein S18 acetylase RimI-like enzyme
MTVEIVRARPGDEGLFDRIAPEVFDQPVRADRLAACLAEPGHILLLAVEDGEVVGQCAAMVHRHPDKATELYVDEIGVSPAWQRRGIGRRLMERMLEIGREQGCGEVWVGTEQDNGPAHMLYARYADADSVVIYQWDL